MVQKSFSENKASGLSNKRNVWLFLGTMGALGLGIGIYLAYTLPSRSISADNYKNALTQLEAAQAEIQTLRHRLDQKNEINLSSGLPHKEILGKMSDNFQKMFLFFKLERHVLTGKNFSNVFHQLQVLMGTTLDHPQFEILKNNTHGLTPPAELEASFRLYKGPQSSEEGTLGNRILSFFNSFVKIRNFQRKEKMDTLCALIRNDHNKEALRFINTHFPDYKDWSQALKNRIEAKKAVASLENLILNSLRIDK